MTDRKELADRLDMMADERPGKAETLREAAAALRQEPSVEEVERFRAWYREHTGKMITRANAMKAISSLYRRTG